MRKSRAFRAAAAAATVLALAGGVAIVPLSANAAQYPVSVAVKAAGAHNALLPGGAAESFTVTVTNNTGKALPFDGLVRGTTFGSLPINDNDVTFSARALSAPATAFVAGNEESAFLGTFYPAGSRDTGAAFTVPAHHSYTWKVTVGAKKAWQAADSSLDLAVGGLPATTQAGYQYAHITYRVGARTTDGPLREYFSNSGTVSPGHPFFTDLDIVNRTGATITAPLQTRFGFIAISPGRPYPALKDLKVWLWNGRSWAVLKSPKSVEGWTLPPASAHFANGTEQTYRLMLSVAADAKAPVNGVTHLEAYTSQGAVNYDAFRIVDNTVTVHQPGGGH